MVHITNNFNPLQELMGLTNQVLCSEMMVEFVPGGIFFFFKYVVLFENHIKLDMNFIDLRIHNVCFSVFFYYRPRSPSIYC